MNLQSRCKDKILFLNAEDQHTPHRRGNEVCQPSCVITEDAQACRNLDYTCLDGKRSDRRRKLTCDLLLSRDQAGQGRSLISDQTSQLWRFIEEWC